MVLAFKTTEQVNRYLKDKHEYLSSRTPIENVHERIFRDCLIDLGIRASYEPFRLYLRGNAKGSTAYKPDFVTNLSVNGRLVILEPHLMKGGTVGRILDDINKFVEFKSIYKEVFYLVVASDLNDFALKFRTSVPLKSYLDEYWEIPGKIGNDKEMSLAKGVVKSHLEGLLTRLKR